jgi:putative peptidoglycan lipid II flippase
MIDRMFLRAGALSLALLLASRLLGVLRESAQAAAFGSGGMADVAVLVLTLPDWIAGRDGQRRAGLCAVAGLGRPAAGAGGGAAAAGRDAGAWRWPAPWRCCWRSGAGRCSPLLGAACRRPARRRCRRPGLERVRRAAALLAALWATRLQHERQFIGMYGANLVVNLVLVAPSRRPAR